MTHGQYNLLFYCTGNSARSILAEAITNYWGADRMHGYSAGIRPTGQVAPEALALLSDLGMPTAHLRSKSIAEFDGPAAPKIDFVFSLCDHLHGEATPPWLGHAITANWSVPDPGLAPPEDRRRAFRRIYRQLENAILTFGSLPLEELDAISLGEELRQIRRRRLRAVAPGKAATPETPGPAGIVDHHSFADRMFLNRAAQRIHDLFFTNLAGQVALNQQLFDYVLVNPKLAHDMLDLLVTDHPELSDEPRNQVTLDADRAEHVLRFGIRAGSLAKQIVISDRH